MSVLPSPPAREMVCGPPFDCLTLVLMVYYLDLVSHLVAVSSSSCTLGWRGDMHSFSPVILSCLRFLLYFFPPRTIGVASRASLYSAIEGVPGSAGVG